MDLYFLCSSSGFHNSLCPAWLMQYLSSDGILLLDNVFQGILRGNHGRMNWIDIIFCVIDYQSLYEYHRVTEYSELEDNQKDHGVQHLSEWPV